METKFSISSYIHFHKFYTENPFFERDFSEYICGVNDWDKFINLQFYLKESIIEKICENGLYSNLSKNMLAKNNIYYALLFYACENNGIIKLKIKIASPLSETINLRTGSDIINPVEISNILVKDGIRIAVHEYSFRADNLFIELTIDEKPMKLDYSINSFKLNRFSKYIFMNKWILNTQSFELKKVNWRSHFLLKNNVLSVKGIIIVSILSNYKKFKRKKIIIISDRIDRGFDNGDYFAEFIYEKKDKDIKVFYAIGKSAHNFNEYKKKYNVLIPGSLKYLFYLTVSDLVISSQLSPWIRYPVKNKKPIRLARIVKSYKVLFLQHGTIINKDISKVYNYCNTTLDMIVSSNKNEHKLLQEAPFLFGKYVQNTGMPRHEKLLTYKKQKQILFMPTWRKDFVSYDKKFEYIFDESFYSSVYYNNLNDLVTNKKLEGVLVSCGFEMKIFMHPCFKNINFPEIHISNIEYINDQTKNITEYIGKSMILITDYSSVKHDAKATGSEIIIFDINNDIPTHLEMEKRFNINSTVEQVADEISKLNNKTQYENKQNKSLEINEKIYSNVKEMLNEN